MLTGKLQTHPQAERPCTESTSKWLGPVTSPGTEVQAGSGQAKRQISSRKNQHSLNLTIPPHGSSHPSEVKPGASRCSPDQLWGSVATFSSGRDQGHFLAVLRALSVRIWPAPGQHLGTSALQNIRDPARSAVSCKATCPGLMPVCSTCIPGA